MMFQLDFVLIWDLAPDLSYHFWGYIEHFGHPSYLGSWLKSFEPFYQEPLRKDGSHFQLAWFLLQGVGEQMITTLRGFDNES